MGKTWHRKHRAEQHRSKPPRKQLELKSNKQQRGQVKNEIRKELSR